MKQLIILIILAGCVCVLSNSNEYVEIPSSSIRMRVIASSDDELDQENKKIIKSVVEEKLYEIIDGLKDKNTIEEAIVSNKDKIDDSIRDEIDRREMGIEFTSNFGYNYFPEKEFKGLTYRAGNYRSFVVTLGKGEGENWWCVLYPPLCLVDENKEDYEYHSLIKDAILKYN